MPIENNSITQIYNFLFKSYIIVFSGFSTKPIVTYINQKR